jgi:hypothetical protein
MENLECVRLPRLQTETTELKMRRQGFGSSPGIVDL